MTEDLFLLTFLSCRSQANLFDIYGMMLVGILIDILERSLISEEV